MTRDENNARAPADGFAAELRGFGPAGIVAILVILLTGNAFVGDMIAVPMGAALVLVWTSLSRPPWRELGLARPASWTAEKEGYYRVRGLRYNFSEEGVFRWQPGNPIMLVVLKRIKSPVPMFAKRVAKGPPVIGEPIGYDLAPSLQPSPSQVTRLHSHHLRFLCFLWPLATFPLFVGLHDRLVPLA